MSNTLPLPCLPCLCFSATARLPGQQHSGPVPGARRPGPEAGPQHLNPKPLQFRCQLSAALANGGAQLSAAVGGGTSVGVM